MEYMIGVIFLAYRELDRRMALCTGKQNKEDRVESVLLNVSIPISKREVCALIPDVSDTYVELILSRLQKEGRIERIGTRKASRYRPVTKR
ncbi:MAG: hypothetical protein J6W53_01405 [Candidatus Methanomethylophilaceae archaeon]|nr:hypothetical protein [Candidatus Methanomethylophilaceae archaeon]